MTIALYMDVHVHRSVTSGLRLRGIDVITAQEDGYHRTPDTELLNRATVLNRVLFSQDDDLLTEAKYRQIHKIDFAGVIYGHQLRTTIGQCVHDMALIAMACDPTDMANRVEYLPL